MSSAGAGAPVFVAQLTDPHLRRGDAERERQLAAAVDAIAGLSVALAAVIVSGDVTDTGHPEECRAAARELGRLPGPVVVLPGNHDDRAALRAAFGLEGEGAEPVRGCVAVGGVRIVACDSVVPGADAGRLEVEWIAARLAEDRATPTLVAVHHPPVPLGSPGIDALGIAEGQRAALADVLAGAPNVIAVLCGHVHRATLSRLGGVPVITGPSSNVQLAFDLLGGLEVAPDEPPAVMLHRISGEGLVSHVVAVPRR